MTGAATLDLTSCGLVEIPAEVFELTNLQRLSTGMTIIRLILAGERHAETLVRHRDPRGKRERATLVQALPGTGRQEQVCAWEQAVARDDCVQKPILACDQQIATCLKAFETQAEIEEAPQRRRPISWPGSVSASIISSATLYR